jgi:RNA polymerase sigma-70 factor (ECF subfamily)
VAPLTTPGAALLGANPTGSAAAESGTRAGMMPGTVGKSSSPIADSAPAPSLLERVAGGDAEAVRLLLDRYEALVWTMARRRLDAALAEDAVQEIFLALWQSAHRFDPRRGSETTFVATVARRRLIDVARRRRRRPEGELPEEFDVAAEPAPDEVERAEDVRAALAAVAELKPAAREVLRMAVVEGLTHDEIASTARLPLGTVKSHVRRGLERVRARLASDPGERRR